MLDLELKECAISLGPTSWIDLYKGGVAGALRIGKEAANSSHVPESHSTRFCNTWETKVRLSLSLLLRSNTGETLEVPSTTTNVHHDKSRK